MLFFYSNQFSQKRIYPVNGRNPEKNDFIKILLPMMISIKEKILNTYCLATSQKLFLTLSLVILANHTI